MSRYLQVDDLYRIAIPSQPSLSPDGTRVAYCLTRPDRDRDGNACTLWVADTDACRPRQLTDGPGDSHPIWSPDGSRILFTRQAGGPAQLWLISPDTGATVRLTDLGEGVGRASWSPDGRRIAFTAGVDLGDDGADRTAAAGPAARDLRPMVADRLDYQADGQPWRRTVRQHVHVLTVPDDAGGTDHAMATVVRLSRGDWDASAPSWSPDGRLLAFTADTEPDSDLTRIRTVHVIPADAPAPAGDHAPRPVGPAGGHLGSVGWIDDATLLAGGRIDTRGGHDTFWRIEVATGRTSPLAPGFDRGIMRGASDGYPGALPQLIDSGSTVLFCAREAGCTYLYAVPAAGGTPRLVMGGAGRVVSGLSARATASEGTRLAVAISDPGSFGEILVTDGDGSSEHACTAHGRDLDDVDLLQRVEREFTVSDGTCVQGWLLRDPDARGPQPLLLDIHGGPHNAWNGSADPVHLYHQVLAARGWTILVLNPRASDGYGERFYTATIGGWGREDARDFLEPLDELVRDGIADPGRLAVTGYSYGGFMTCYLTAHDDRFAAAVTGGPVTDLISDCGTSDDGHYMAEAEMHHPWWRDPDPYRDLSPLHAVAGVSTPTLILQGNDDVRCPRGQAQQWFTALRERRIPARLVLYPGSSHLFPYTGRPSHRVDYNERVIDWVQRYAGGAR